MNGEIKVSVFRRDGQKIYYMQYRDPVTGDKVRRSTRKMTKRDAERTAAKWEAELIEGRAKKLLGRMPWTEFRQLYEDEVVASLAERTDDKITSVFNVLERTIKPTRLSDLNESNLSRYQAELRGQGRAETTIKGHLAHILAALNWANDKKLVGDVPTVKMPKRARKGKVMKGRPITTEEFERMLAATPKAIFPDGCRVREDRKPRIAESWKFYIEGLWWSGLRLEESTELHWTDRSKLCVLDLDGRQPMLWIPGELEKGNQDRILPMAPEFAEFLRNVPECEREGYVFNPLARRHRYASRLSAHNVMLVVGKIGREAIAVKPNDEQRVHPPYNSVFHHDTLEYRLWM